MCPRHRADVFCDVLAPNRTMFASDIGKSLLNHSKRYESENKQKESI